MSKSELKTVEYNAQKLGKELREFLKLVNKMHEQLMTIQLRIDVISPRPVKPAKKKPAKKKGAK